jgi:hypothetical protein
MIGRRCLCLAIAQRGMGSVWQKFLPSAAWRCSTSPWARHRQARVWTIWAGRAGKGRDAGLALTVAYRRPLPAWGGDGLMGRGTGVAFSCRSLGHRRRGGAGRAGGGLKGASIP